MPESEIKRMNPFDRLVSLFVAPASLMKNIRIFPAVLVPLIVCTLLGLALMPFSSNLADIQMHEFSNLSIERYGVDYFNTTPVDDELAAVMPDISTITNISAVVSAFIAYPVIAFFLALGTFILTKIARGKELKLIQYFSMYIHLCVLTAIGAVVTTVLCVSLGSILDVTSLAALFMPLGNVTMPAFNALSGITVFGLWVTVLAIIGIKHINHFSYLKATVIGLVGFAFSLGFYTISTSLTFLTYDIINGMTITL
ncbi:MAG: hypothetical protein LBR83_09645 [Clostridiales bacterium]|jgi:hypothetical protein|nr:hypothetical protein [Clostridiales bacterium]